MNSVTEQLLAYNIIRFLYVLRWKQKNNRAPSLIFDDTLLWKPSAERSIALL
jgi:hypothetical protein